MGCPASVGIGKNITFGICCHDPDTGVLTDADSAPSYRIYEDETATAILTGSLAKLDDANTTGFYTETIACTVANGFEKDKTYSVYIEATVDSDTGGITYAFRVDDVDGLTLEEALKIILSKTAGIASGGGTTSIAFRDQGDTKNVITMTVDANGNRSAVTVDGT